ncbi:MAG: hypothetical protein EPN14_06125 [Gallionella sp.]|nr:MAG: hypothetical protein EPN14_06125 [Gallionella sp.]
MSAWGTRLGSQVRRMVHGVCWIAILSGLLWIALGWGLDPQDFANPLRGWRHRLLVAHGVSAYVLLWVAGSLLALHQMGNWRARRNRASGLALTGALLLLALSGLTLYYPPHEDWRDAFSLFHQVLGASVALLIPLHIRLGKKARPLRHP